MAYFTRELLNSPACKLVSEMKKKILIALGVVLAVIAVAVALSVPRAGERQPPPPDPFEAGRAKLYQQLEDSERREAAIEQQDWNSPALLTALIAAHQSRIDKLAGNSQAGEIVAHDKDSIARLRKRIQDLADQAREKPPAGATAPSPKQ